MPPPDSSVSASSVLDSSTATVSASKKSTTPKRTIEKSTALFITLAVAGLIGYYFTHNKLCLIGAAPLAFKCVGKVVPYIAKGINLLLNPFIRQKHFAFWVVVALVCVAVSAITYDSGTIFGHHLPRGSLMVGLIPMTFLFAKSFVAMHKKEHNINDIKSLVEDIQKGYLPSEIAPGIVERNKTDLRRPDEPTILKRIFGCGQVKGLVDDFTSDRQQRLYVYEELLKHTSLRNLPDVASMKKKLKDLDCPDIELCQDAYIKLKEFNERQQKLVLAARASTQSSSSSSSSISSAAEPAPTPAPDLIASTPASTPDPAPASALASTPAPALASTPAPALASTPALAFAPALKPASAPASTPAPALTPDPSSLSSGFLDLEFIRRQVVGLSPSEIENYKDIIKKSLPPSSSISSGAPFNLIDLERMFQLAPTPSISPAPVPDFTPAPAPASASALSPDSAPASASSSSSSAKSLSSSTSPRPTKRESIEKPLKFPQLSRYKGLTITK